jgi:hypothetical protein
MPGPVQQDPALGEALVKWVFGALVVEITGLEGYEVPDRDVLERFTCDGPADVEVRVGDDLGTRRGVAAGQRPVTSVDRSARIIDFEVYSWAARLDLDRRIVDVTMAKDQARSFPHVLSVVAQVYTVYLHRGLLLHASAVVRDGRGVIFAARSETGKTTLARISRDLDCPVITEEMACIVGLEDGAEPAVRVLPLREKEDLLVKEPLEAPLGAVYWLVQAAGTRIESLSPPEQLKHAAMATAIGVRDALLMEPALDAAAALIDRVPLKLLHFERSPRLWDVVDRDLGDRESVERR